MMRKRGLLTLFVLLVVALGVWLYSTRSNGVTGDQADRDTRKPGGHGVSGNGNRSRLTE